MSKKIIGVVGIRQFDNMQLFVAKLEKKLKRFDPDDELEFITTEENGVAALARQHFTENDTKFSIMRAMWDDVGARAGYLRNEALVDASKELFVFWDGKDVFLQDLIDYAIRFKRRINIIFIDPTEATSKFTVDAKRVKIPKAK